jgi:hypothetical protein
MESQPSPVGIIYQTSNSGTVDVIMSGSVSKYSGLKRGALYYTNSLGEIIGGNVYFGHFDTCYEDDISNTLVSSKSVVGVAISEDTLLLQLNK